MKTQEEIYEKIQELHAKIEVLNTEKKQQLIPSVYESYQEKIIKLTNQSLTLYWVLGSTDEL